MAVSRSQFLTIRVPEPDISAGWSIRVLDYKNMTQPVAISHEFTTFSFTQELNGPGTGTITFDEDSPFWTAILTNDLSNRTLQDNEYIFEAWDGGKPRFAWMATTVTNSIVGEDETRAVSISGPGIAQVLKWARVGRPGWPTKVPIIGHAPNRAKPAEPIPLYQATSSSDMLPAFGWEFTPTWPTMRMWYTVLKAAQRRGLVPWVKPLFSATKDSAGKDWVWIKTIENVTATTNPLTGKKTTYGFQPQDRNQNLLDFLADCTGQDYSTWFGQRLEWIMYPGFKLDVRPHIGVDRSNTVRFFQGNIISDERTRDREEIANRVIAMDEIGGESVRTDNVSVGKWNLRERWDESNKQVLVASVRDQLADRYIKQTKDEKDQWTIRIPYDDPGRIPYRNFNVGDHVGVNAEYFGSTPTAIANPTKYRVLAITISLSVEQTVPDCELILKTIFDTKLEDLQKQITQLMNKPTNASATDMQNIVNNTLADAGLGGDGERGIKAFFDDKEPTDAQPGDLWTRG